MAAKRAALPFAFWCCHLGRLHRSHFFRAPRAIGVGVLFFQAGTGYLLGGGLGGFFICREFAQYHFGMDAERLGEYWFAFESIAVWSLAAATLAVLRIFARKLQVAEGQTNEET